MLRKLMLVAVLVVAGCVSPSSTQTGSLSGPEAKAFSTKLDRAIAASSAMMKPRLSFFRVQGSAEEKRKFLSQADYVFPRDQENQYRRSVGLPERTEELICFHHCRANPCHLPLPEGEDCGNVICWDECQCGPKVPC